MGRGPWIPRRQLGDGRRHHCRDRRQDEPMADRRPSDFLGRSLPRSERERGETGQEQHSTRQSVPALGSGRGGHRRHMREGFLLSREIYRLKARRGHKRAVVAIAHKVLIAIYHVLTSDTHYQELGADYLERSEPERLKHNLVRRLERLGYQVSLESKRV